MVSSHCNRRRRRSQIKIFRVQLEDIELKPPCGNVQLRINVNAFLFIEEWMCKFPCPLQRVFLRCAVDSSVCGVLRLGDLIRDQIHEAVTRHGMVPSFCRCGGASPSYPLMGLCGTPLTNGTHRVPKVRNDTPRMPSISHKGAT